MENKEISHHNNETHSFYLFVVIITFAIIVLQPLAMLTVIFMQSILQQ